MARFTLTLVIDDDSFESVEDVQDAVNDAWSDRNTRRAVALEAVRPSGGQVSFALAVDPSSFGIRLDRPTPKP